MQRTGKPRPLKGLLAQLLSQKTWRRGILAARIRTLWPEIIGPEIAAHTTPLSLTRGRLTIECDHDVWRTELSYLRPELIQRIREALGDDSVKEIWLK